MPDPNNYGEGYFKQLGYKSLTTQEIAKLQPVDTVLADLAIDKLDVLAGEENDKGPFFLAVGFRLVENEIIRFVFKL